MRYLLYVLWSAIFYLLFLTIYSEWNPLEPRLFLYSLIVPLGMKKWLPFFKNTKFPEFDAWWKMIESMTTRPKKCSICSSETNFKIILGSNSDANLSPKKTRILCRLHGLEEWKKELMCFKGIMVIAEPDIDRNSGLFFYKPDDLKFHAYKKQDKEALERIMQSFIDSKEQNRICWLPKDIVGSCHDSPLFKKEEGFEFLTIDEAVSRINTILQQIENKYLKGELWITEPRGNKGVYIWDSEV